MYFDVVIGNPPYNDDLYLDFVNMSYDVIKEDGAVVMITPAKWQAKASQKNIDFRENMVIHMKDIIYYIDTKELFDIGEPDGISIYNINKGKYNTKNLKLQCSSNKAFNTDWETVDCSEHTRLLSNIMQSIVNKCSINGTIEDKLSFKRQLYCDESETGTPVRDAEHCIGLYQNADSINGEPKLSGYLTVLWLKNIGNLDRYKCIQSIRTVRGAGNAFGEDGRTLGGNLITILGPNQVCKGTFQELIAFDTLLEAESFKSFIMSKLCSFLLFVGICGHVENAEFYRYVPDIDEFDHIYTDEELYSKYSLSLEEINLIESVIRSRK